MPIDPQLQELLDRWEDLRERGKEISAQELCREHPELLEELKRRIKALQAMSWLLDTDPSEGDDSSRPPLTLGRYRLDQLIGKGGFGQVWKGYDPDLQRIVAIKVPRPDRLSQKQARAFLEEARKVAQLRHPGIVPVHDVGYEGRYCYIVSDCVEGGSLAERLRSGRANWREATRLIAAIAETLAHAHQQGFVHRDIKPGNILLDLHGQPYLTDFGIAVNREELLAGFQQNSGTLAYMSPEQILGKPVDFRSDIYSLGVVLFEMLAGKRPYDDGTARNLREQILSPAPAYLRLHGVPAGLEQICQKCLQTKPEDRYATANEVAVALNDLLQPPRAKARGLPAVVLLLLILVGLLTTGFWMISDWHRHSSPLSFVNQTPPMPLVPVEPIRETAPLTPLEKPTTTKPPVDNEARPKVAAPAVSKAPAPPSSAPVTEKLATTPPLPSQREEAQKSLMRGIGLFESNKFQEAIPPLTEAIQHDPQLAAAYHRRGASYFNLGEIDKSLADFNQAIELDPQNAETWKHRALAHLRLTRFDEAMADAKEGLRLDSAHSTSYTSVMVMVYAARATDHSNHQRWKEAIADLTTILQLDPQNVTAHANRGVAHYNMRDFAQAIADFSNAIKLNPAVSSFYLHRSFAYRAVGRVKEAKADEEKARSLQ